MQAFMEMLKLTLLLYLYTQTLPIASRFKPLLSLALLSPWPQPKHLSKHVWEFHMCPPPLLRGTFLMEASPCLFHLLSCIEWATFLPLPFHNFLIKLLLPLHLPFTQTCTLMCKVGMESWWGRRFPLLVCFTSNHFIVLQLLTPFYSLAQYPPIPQL